MKTLPARNMDYKKIRAYAEWAWFEIIEELAPELTPAIHKYPRHVPCPVHGGIDVFLFFNDVEKTGGGVCNTYGKLLGTT